jgi:glycosyltransferase involved in cell wall biosynthesis
LTLPDHELVVASGGSELPHLMTLARGARNIKFTNWVNDEELMRLIGHSTATLYIPEDEDFGMSAVESMAAGKPVIAVSEGGLRETMIHGETGFSLPADPTPAEIAQAVRQLTPDRAATMRAACTERAQFFSTQRFLDAFQIALRPDAP